MIPSEVESAVASTPLLISDLAKFCLENLSLRVVRFLDLSPDVVATRVILINTRNFRQRFRTLRLNHFHRCQTSPDRHALRLVSVSV